jgi:hypothetical protein
VWGEVELPQSIVSLVGWEGRPRDNKIIMRGDKKRDEVPAETTCTTTTTAHFPTCSCKKRELLLFYGTKEGKGGYAIWPMYSTFTTYYVHVIQVRGRAVMSSGKLSDITQDADAVEENVMSYFANAKMPIPINWNEEL